METCTLYVTCRDRAEALTIGRSVVAERLAACANILDGMTSLYWWEGEVAQDEEAVLLLKTPSSQVPALTARIQALHSYDLPCIVAWPIVGGHSPYLDWIVQETRPHA